MAILLYFLAGLALIAGGIWGFTVDMELWVSLVLIGSGLGSIAISLYKLDEETDCFSNAIARRKARKIDRIAHGKFKKQPLNMVPMLIEAYDARKEFGADHIKKQALRCIASAYETLWKNWRLVVRERPDLMKNISEDTSHNALFRAMESLLIVFIGVDDDLDTEYDIYRKFCKRVNKDFTPRTKKQLKEQMDFLCAEDEKGDPRIFLSTDFIRIICRGCIPSSTYQDLVQGFCYLTLADNSVYEIEYLLLRGVFFDKGLDTFPETWEQFKKEY